MVKILQNVKIKMLCKLLNLHRVLFCTGTGIALDDIVQIDCLAFKYFVKYLSHFIGWLQHLALCSV